MVDENKASAINLKHIGVDVAGRRQHKNKESYMYIHVIMVTK